MSVSKSYFTHDKEELLNTLARFDGALTVEDVTDGVNVSSDYYSRHNHTVFLQILLEAICSGFVRHEQQREILLTEICQRLSIYKVIDPTLLMNTRNPVRIEIKQKFFDFVRTTLKEVIPQPDIDSSAISFLENSNLSADPEVCFYKCFEELGEIGRGGFGVVFKAKNRLTGHIYAVKKILFKYKNDDCYLKVMREAKSIAALDHPNIVHYNNAWLEVAPANYDYVNKSLDNDSSDSDNVDSNTFDDYDVAFAKEGVSAIVMRDKCSSESSESSGTIESHVSLTSSDQNFEDSSDSVIFSYSAQEYSQNVKWPVESDSEIASEDTVDEASSNKNSLNVQSVSLNESFKLNLNVCAMLYIQMEFCDTDLRFWLDERAKGNKLPFEMDVTEIFANILKGVAHIHSKCIIHRDLKPQNIFYSKTSKCLKIGDFGLATLANCSSNTSNGSHVFNHHSTNIGTRPYAAPEQIESQLYNSKVDIYSLGIILIELMNTFSTYMEFSRGITEIKNGRQTEEMRKLPKLAVLLPNLVSKNPEDRRAAEDILSDLKEDAKVKLKEYEKALEEKNLQLKNMNERLIIMEAEIRKKDEENKKLRTQIKKLHAEKSN